MIKILKDREHIKSGPNCVVVTCTINACELYNEDSKYAMYFALEKNVTFVGVARRKDGDENNEIEATRIAEAKMERSFYKFIRSKQKRYVEDSKLYLKTIEEELEQTNRTLTRIDKHIKDICNRLK